MFSVFALIGTLVMGAGHTEGVWAEEEEIYPEVVVEINETNFPDEIFRKYVSNSFDTDNNCVLSDIEINNVSQVNVDNMGIVDLQGIECFVNINELNCARNDMTSLDVSKNTALEKLYCPETLLMSLDVSKNTALKTIFCSYSPNLTSLKVSKNSVLERIDCYETELVSLDVSGCKALTYLDCHKSKLTSLNASGCAALKTLSCWSNNLADLDVSVCKELTELVCSTNQLTSLDVSNNTALTQLACSFNQLSSLDVSRNPELISLKCQGNELEKLDITNNQAIVKECMDRGLTLNYDGSVYICEDPNHYGQEPLIVDSFVELVPRLCEPIPKLSNTPTPTATPIPANPATPTPTKSATPLPTKAPSLTVTPTPTDTPTPLPTTTPIIENPTIGDFAERLYTVALNRESDPSGKDYWTKEIENGNRTGGDCAHFFLIEAEEFRNRGLNEEDFVETLYQTFFGRASEPNGKAYWVGELKNGTRTREDVINGFIDSTEWCNICATYGVKSGAPNAKAEIASADAIGFATRLYTCCLGREPEDGGLKYWSLALTNLEQTGYGAAKFFFMGDEFVNFKTTNEEFVTRLYTTFMDREPESGGFNYWVGELKKGKSREDVMSSFAQCQEFANICAKYGIDRGEI